jgi:anti-sigma factor RsiW
MCPDRELLSAFVDGEVPSPWRERIVEHLRACASCAKAVERFSALGAEIRGMGGDDEAAAVERLGSRIEPLIAAARGRQSAHVPILVSKPTVWRARLSLPLPLVAAAAVFLLVVGVGAARLLAPRTSSSAAIATAEMAQPASAPASMDALLRYLDSKDAQVTLTIRLPTGATFDSTGSPTIMRAPVQTGTPVLAPPNGNQSPGAQKDGNN